VASLGTQRGIFLESKSDDIEKAFPHLTEEGYAVTSPKDKNYNCIAWAAGANDAWWDSKTGYSWPEGALRNDSVQALIAAYASLGYEICQRSALEFAFEKIAIYGEDGAWTHASRQLPSGKWASKLGGQEDIEHANPEAVADSGYGKVVCIMKRAIQKADF
jgi:hypothetical protein